MVKLVLDLTDITNVITTFCPNGCWYSGAISASMNFEAHTDVLLLDCQQVLASRLR